MDYLLIALVSFAASALTLFSGFGLGTILTPVFAVFFPVSAAVAATAVVHFLNNLFKLALVGRSADRRAVLRFGAPAVVSALAGAYLLNYVSALPALAAYRLGGAVHEVTAVKLVIGILIIGFSLLELVPASGAFSFGPAFMPLGGVLSGFFGGLSGNQGAFRSMFLIRAGLSKEGFIGTNVVIAVMVDMARLAVYGLSFYGARFAAARGTERYVLVSVLAAFAGAYLGKRFLRSVTYRAVQAAVAVMLVLLGAGLAAGLI